MQQAIVVDILKRPEIHAITFTKYTGFNKGDIIAIEATDDHRVENVSVSIYAGDQLIEQGNANNTNGSIDYFYTLQQDIDAATAYLVVSVTDYADNVTTKKVAVSDVSPL